MVFKSVGGRRGPTLVLVIALLAQASPSQAHDSITQQIARLTAELKSDPGNARLFLRRGELRRMNREWRDALADLDRAAALEPTLTRVDLVRAHVLLDASRPADAAAAASRFLLVNIDNPDALTVRARALVRLRRFDAAAADFTRALAREPLPDVYIERARAQSTDGAAGQAQALAGLDEALARLGPVVALELEALELETRLGLVDRAVHRIDRLAATASRQETWLARRGAVLARAGRVRDARVSYQAALDAANRLPAWTRQTRATQQLITGIRAELERLQHSLNE